MSDDEHTRPSRETKEEEEHDAQVRSGASREPKPEEAEAAERARANQPGGVGEHYEEMIERGANQKGEGRIEPQVPDAQEGDPRARLFGHRRRGNDGPMESPLGATSGAKSLPLILAREFAANLATPMFLLDARGMLVFYNDAAAELIGKPFMEVGEIPSAEFAEVLQVTSLDGSPIHRNDSPAGIAFFQQRPAHQTLYATGYNGVRRALHSTAYPLFGTEGDMHGVFNVFWELPPDEVPA